MKCIKQSDGTLVTEKKKTTEHEEIIDKDLPDGDNQSTGSREKILNHKVSSRVTDAVGVLIQLRFIQFMTSVAYRITFDLYRRNGWICVEIMEQE